MPLPEGVRLPSKPYFLSIRICDRKSIPQLSAPPRQQRAVDDAPVAPALFAKRPVRGDNVGLAVPLFAEHFLRIGFCRFWMGIGQFGFKHRPPPTRSVVMPISSYLFLQAVKDFAHVSGYPRTSLPIGMFWRILRPRSCEVSQCLRALSNILAL
jgi:hypothetical protein